MRFLPRSRRERGVVHTVTDARRPMSEDIAYRQRRYLISMGVRVVAFLLAVFLFHGVWRFVLAGVALVVPYFAVVFANGGREPDSAASFESAGPGPGHGGGPPAVLPSAHEHSLGQPADAARPRPGPHAAPDGAQEAARTERESEAFLSDRQDQHGRWDQAGARKP